MYIHTTNKFPNTDKSFREDSSVYMYVTKSVFGEILRKESIMATLKLRRAKWFSRVTWYDKTGRRKEVQIPLRTKSKVEARLRHSQVEKYRSEIIELYLKGEKYDFPWMNEDGELKIISFNFQMAIEEWLSLRESQGIAKSTINRNKHSINTITNILGNNIKLDEISTKTIEYYIKRMQQKGYKPNGININLRTLRTFLNWCKRRNYLDSIPYFTQVKTDKSLPTYISDNEFNEIIELVWLDEHYKNVFLFYRDTGCRLSEPFIGKLTGAVLIIPAKYSKSRIEKEIDIDIKLIPILLEMQNKYQSWLNTVKKPILKYYTENYSKVFKKCCRTIGIDRRFHDLRHTFAIRRYLVTKDIYKVMKEMGHSKVTTTQIYTKFNTRRLENDFPKLAKSYNSLNNFIKVDTELVDTKVVYSS